MRAAEERRLKREKEAARIQTGSNTPVINVSEFHSFTNEPIEMVEDLAEADRRRPATQLMSIKDDGDD